MVRDHAEAGYDYLKLHSLKSRDIYDAVLDEAARVGLPVIARRRAGSPRNRDRHVAGPPCPVDLATVANWFAAPRTQPQTEEHNMSTTASTKQVSAKKRSNVAAYLKAHPTLKIVGQQPDFIEPMDTPAKLREYNELVANSITNLPLGYQEPIGGGETGTFSYVGDRPVIVDHDSET